MLIIHNPVHSLHQGREEMFRGRMVASHETPSRLATVLGELESRALGTILPLEEEPQGFDALLGRVHTPTYLKCLESAWSDWVALDPENASRDALPSVWPGPGMRRDVLPANFAARLGAFAFDSGTPLTRGTWTAARAGAACAVTAARAVARGDAPGRAAFALTRPPGHHAGPDFMGGYCFLNNAALAAQALRDAGFARVAVLDVDFHHGNGTQTIFYGRADVFTASIHGDPRTEYPFFLGHADETGTGAGTGFNLNLPLPRGSEFGSWRTALSKALEAIVAFDADALVVPLGLDTFEGDPISGFCLRTADYLAMGQELAAAQLPTVLVFEGGYAVAALGANTADVLEGFVR